MSKTHLTDIVQGNMQKLQDDFAVMFDRADRETQPGDEWAAYMESFFIASQTALIQAMIDGVKKQMIDWKYFEADGTSGVEGECTVCNSIEHEATHPCEIYNTSLQSILSDLEAARGEITKNI